MSQDSGGVAPALAKVEALKAEVAKLGGELTFAKGERAMSRNVDRAARTREQSTREEKKRKLAQLARAKAELPPRARSEASEKRGWRCRTCKGARRLPGYVHCRRCLTCKKCRIARPIPDLEVCATCLEAASLALKASAQLRTNEPAGHSA